MIKKDLLKQFKEAFATGKCPECGAMMYTENDPANDALGMSSCSNMNCGFFTSECIDHADICKAIELPKLDSGEIIYRYHYNGTCACCGKLHSTDNPVSSWLDVYDVDGAKQVVEVPVCHECKFGETYEESMIKLKHAKKGLDTIGDMFL